MAVEEVLKDVGENPIARVCLVPWDPDSDFQVKRMHQQRTSCGWHQWFVEDKWTVQQREGHKSIHWIVLDSPNPTVDETLIRKHLAKYPDEATPLMDSATSLRAQPITPSYSKPFIPVGHISLDSDGADPEGKLSYDLKDVYRIVAFYVSRALHGSGVGRQAMDALESITASPPFSAKTLVISTAADDYPHRIEKFKALGRKLPMHSISEWYARRGYVQYKLVEEAWWEPDKTGKQWAASAVYMKKDVVQF
ncbi:hypothetical protein BJ875DRAFT_454432 [Amylocarpus encephaloides]|uniref:N-acetyltransferase domain-containing protein n=1 Tax=Amylocarpus encephaloides TaxID=45428 RepID=A0A9P7YP57_9HELO|nr:hypothetical protein BJ875DRAFT_454432 [Amylocarpus encephaloides]